MRGPVDSELPPTPPERAVHDACRREIEDLHAFFEDWFAGRPARDGEAFGRVEAALAEGFQLVGPDGVRHVRDELLAGLRAAHGTRAGGFRIWTRAARSRPLAEGLHLAVYEEWQELAGVERGRLSTALFREREDGPNGVEWLHVHETWLPDAAKAAPM